MFQFIATPWLAIRYYQHALYDEHWYIPSFVWHLFPGMTYYKALQIMSVCKEIKCKEAEVGHLQSLGGIQMLKLISENDDNSVYISICSCCGGIGVLPKKPYP